MHTFERARASVGDDEEGMTLIEVIAAMVVFAIASVSIVSLLATSLVTSRTNRQRVTASQLSSRTLDTMRDAIKNNVSVPAGVSTTTSTVSGTLYTLTTNVSFVSLAQTTDSCGGGLGSKIAYERIKTTVTWVGMGRTKPIRNDGIVTPPAGSLNANTISIPIKVVSSALVGQPNILVTLTPTAGGTSLTQTTDDTGCASFSQIATGTYNAVLNAVGYVDKNGLQNHTEPALGQSTPGTAPVTTILYDIPGTLTLQASTAAAGGFTSFPLPTAFSYTATQTGWTGTSKVFTGTPAGLTTVPSVFPFTTASGGVYSAYVGTCSDGGSNPATGKLVVSNLTTALAVPVASTLITFKNGATTLPNGSVTVKSSLVPCTDAYSWPSTNLNTASGFAASLPYGSLIFKLTDTAGKVWTSAATVISSSTPATLTLAMT